MPSRVDTLAQVALQRGDITADPITGAIHKANGDRAELLDKRTGYGRVQVFAKPLTLAMAHRVIWIAAHGLIPDGLQVNHINRRRWDNRIANLELVTPKGNSRHWRGYGYDRIGEQPDSVDIDWLNRMGGGEKPPKQVSPYHSNSKTRVGPQLM
ncbi:HNH endonuclease signature motif containing protein [Micromonospora maritima]|uniref:HNH endonuclease signature motif containing protein n=1 Tax=Micromonospora maritima TaxID=986711 RepID=UPI00157C3DC6|nr:HNH endonuclease signature motif containing protein [Micromonospora maritima]